MHKLHQELALAIKGLFNQGSSARHYFDNFINRQNIIDFIIGMASLSPFVKMQLANCFGVSYGTVCDWNCLEAHYISVPLAIKVSKFMIKAIDEANE